GDGNRLAGGAGAADGDEKDRAAGAARHIRIGVEPELPARSSAGRCREQRLPEGGSSNREIVGGATAGKEDVAEVILLPEGAQGVCVLADGGNRLLPCVGLGDNFAIGRVAVVHV